MLKNIFFLLTIVIGFASCATKNDQNRTKELNEVHTDKGQLIENDSLAFVLGSQFEYFAQTHSIDSYSDELIENLHSFDQSIDTLRTFLINEIKFKKYIFNDGKETLIYAKIEKGNEGISDLIRIGNHKENLSQAWELEFKSDTITISNQDHTYLFFLYFEQEKLSGMTFEAYMD